MERTIREIVLFIAAFIVLPIKTIRAIIWEWQFWLDRVEKKIQKDHDDYFNI